MNKSDVKTLNIDEIRMKFEKNQINFKPSYQRKSGIWRDNKKLRLIDSILSGYIIPVIYFRSNPNNSNIWDVVDGSQRLSTIKEYLIENKKFEFEKYGMDKYKHYDNMTWEEFISMPWPKIFELSHCEGEDIKRMQDFKVEYILITSANEEEMIEVFQRLNSGEPLSEGEWLTCLLPSLPLWNITQEFADICYQKHKHDIYNYKKDGSIHEDFDPLRNMDAWFWANVALFIYQYEMNREIKFSNGKRTVILDEYDKLQKQYYALSDAEKNTNIELCKRIKENMIETLELFVTICKLMQNEFKRPKALFTIFAYSYINRNNLTLISNLKKHNNIFAKRIRIFSGEKIEKNDNERIINFTEEVLNLYKKHNDNTSNARLGRYRCFEKLLGKE